MASLEVLAARFRSLAETTTATRAPLYSKLSAAAADDPGLVRLLQAAPEQQQIPVLLFAAVHHLLLQGLGSELAAHYPNLATAPASGDPVPLFRAFALDHADALTELISTRHTQTNEVGRCAQFVPAMGLLADERGALAHIDVGTSAGLNLLLPRYSYEYEPGGTVGSSSTVHVHCSARGDTAVPVPASMPSISRSIGLDLMPIDVLDDDEVRWLEACVWPDQADRFARLVAAIDLARANPPDVRRGDAVADIAELVHEAAAHGHPVVTNSWVLNYLPHDVREDYVAELEALGAAIDLSWIIAEAPAQTPGLPVPTADPPEEITVVSLVRWRRGERSVRRLATTHPHGYWLRWERSPD
ncbi:MAG: DUF2332 domain-containing protein [Actinobacteria bacterium]|nr:DUF2332 domain-containing protein [Actinomycetota bacterium]